MSERGPQHQSWYLSRDGKQYGPYAGDEILRLAEAGTFRPDDLIWKPGFAGWKPLHAVSGLITPPPAPAVPKLLAGLITSAPLPPPLPQAVQQESPPPPEAKRAEDVAASIEAPPALPRQGATAPAAQSVSGRPQAEPGSAAEWIERLPFRWARNGAIAGAVLGTSYVVTDPDGVYLLAIATALLGACGAVAGFFARDRLHRLRAFDSARASGAIDVLPLRYAIWGASLGGIPALLSIGDIPYLVPEIPIGAVGAFLIALGAALICGAAGFLVGFVLQRNLRQRSPQMGQGAKAPAGPRWNNVIARHWRGELSLPVSYWVVGFLGNIAAYAIVLGLSSLFVGDESYHPLPIFFCLAAIWLAIVVITVWQLVGLWRSARRYRKERIQAGRSAFWGGVAHIMAALAIVQLGATIFYAGLPQLNEVSRMAFLDDPEMGPYAIRIMRNGTEAEITGGFKYGLTADFVRVFNASPQISVVHLDSPGGRIGEALALNKAIKERGLMTYVSNECQSACAVAFAAGRVRWMRDGAVIGFHASRFPGMSKKELAESDTIQGRVYREAGFDPDFVERALATPSDDMLTPSAGELVKAGVVSAVSDGSEFAVSGYGGQVSKDTLAESLVKLWPVLGAMKERLPQDYAALIDGWYRGYLKGDTEAAILDGFWATLYPLMMAHLRHADDDVLIDFAALSAEEFAALGKKDPALCHRYASGSDMTGSFYRHLPEALLNRELDIYKRIVETMATRPKSAEAEITRLFAKLSKTITQERMDLALAKEVSPEKYEDYCRAWVDLNQEIVGLRESEAAALLRAFASDAQGEEPTAAVPKEAPSKTSPNAAAILLAAIEARFPQDYGELTKNLDQVTIKGMTATEIVATIGPALQRFMRAKIPLADDDVLIDLGALRAEQLTVLRAKDAKLCFLYLSGHEQEAYAEMPKALIERETVLYARAVATAAERPKISEKALDAIRSKTRRDVSVEELELLGAPNVTPDQYAEVCRIAIATFRAPERLKPSESAAILRHFWGVE